jgi:hypothetical protein
LTVAVSFSAQEMYDQMRPRFSLKHEVGHLQEHRVAISNVGWRQLGVYC